jgi:hypothetical protein
MKKEKFPSLTIRDHGHVITHRFEFIDPTLNDWFTAFKGLLIGITFHEQSVDNYLIECGQELMDHACILGD